MKLGLALACWATKLKHRLNLGKPCDLDPLHTSTQLPDVCEEKRFPLHSCLSQLKTTLQHVYQLNKVNVSFFSIQGSAGERGQPGRQGAKVSK